MKEGLVLVKIANSKTNIQTQWLTFTDQFQPAAAPHIRTAARTAMLPEARAAALARINSGFSVNSSFKKSIKNMSIESPTLQRLPSFSLAPMNLQVFVSS